jgi:hypothetical protein
MSFGGSGSTSTQGLPGAARPVLRDLARQYGQGSQQGLTTPFSGTFGSIFQNLFGANAGPGEDFLGARGALQDTLSGGGLQPAFDTAYQQLLPGAERTTAAGINAIKAGTGAMGGRFSTDQNQQITSFIGGQGADLQGRALSAALPIAQQRGAAASNLYNLFAQIGQGQTPLALGQSIIGMQQPTTAGSSGSTQGLS